MSDRGAEPLEHGHSHEEIRQRLGSDHRLSYLRDWVYGGIDGVVTTLPLRPASRARICRRRC
jgi:hypothetical protein